MRFVANTRCCHSVIRLFCVARNGASPRRAYSDYVVRNTAHFLDKVDSTTNFAEYVLGGAGGRGDRIALVCSDTGLQVTYGALWDATARWGGYLKQRGLGGKGTVVGVMSPNSVDYPPVVLGTILAGGVYTGLSPTYTPREIAHQLSDSGASLLVVGGGQVAAAREAVAAAGLDVPLVVLGPSNGSGLPCTADIVRDSAVKFAEPAQVEGEDPMAVLYSSGTTGRPKGVAIPHSAIVSNLAMLSSSPYCISRLSTADVPTFTMLLPFAHIAGLLLLLGLGIRTGARLVVFSKFAPQTFVGKLLEYKVNILQLVPSLLNATLTDPRFTRENFGFVDALLCGGSPVPPSAAAAFLERVGGAAQVLQAYGMTECLITHHDPLGGTRLGYTGQIFPGLEAKVVHPETREDLSPSQTGELCIRGPTLMTGYVNNPAATAATIDEDGWLHSGDIGHYDQDGFVKVVDRMKELIKVNALQVSPSELEDVILQLPEVQDVGVVGVPHPKLGEVPRAYVVVRDDFDVKKVVDHVARNCAPHKHLKGGVGVLSAMPKNPTGKIMKKELVKLAAEGK